MNFFKNKFNMAILIVQCVAIICYLLGFLWGGMSLLFFACEGVFFVVWGIKCIFLARDNKTYLNDELDVKQLNKINKKEKWENKNNILIGIGLILLGGMLIFSLVSRII